MDTKASANNAVSQLSREFAIKCDDLVNNAAIFVTCVTSGMIPAE